MINDLSYPSPLARSHKEIYIKLSEISPSQTETAITRTEQRSPKYSYLFPKCPRFRAITPNRLRLNNFYAISGLLCQTTKYDDKVEFFIKACSFELLSVRTILTQPQGSRNVPRTAPPDDFENFIHKKFHSEQSLKCQRTNYDSIAENLQEISSPDVQFLKPAVSAPTVPTPPIKFTMTAINTGSIQNITLNKFQEGEAQKPNSPIHSMSGIKDPINEEK
ncbi:hypothetical protein Glove_441g19 [Diversispora epigaea]|uniref:Uncharacterized protein n=1 Tax=Diversispora epigaea TaxID=1348612 RepID=A0A397GZH3_9GLOM|nr:hypothetical protein Glove_441g19 [Diversispora epigaea]